MGSLCERMNVSVINLHKLTGMALVIVLNVIQTEQWCQLVYILV